MTDDENQREVDEVKSALDGVADVLVREFEAAEVDRLNRWRALHPEFRGRFETVWGKALDSLELFIADAVFFGSRFNDRHREAAARESDCRFEAVIRLHGKACQAALEALALMRAGLAAGAMARWRTIHETTVIALFLAQGDPELSRRYLLHVVTSAERIGKAYATHRERLRHEAPTAQELADLAASRAALELEFGKEFSRGDYGWCATEFPGVGRVGLHHLEKHVDLAHWYPLYISACIPVHAGSRSLSANIGAPLDEHTRSIFCGYSNLGIDTVGGLVAHSLGKISATLLMIRENDDVAEFTGEYGWIKYLDRRTTRVESTLGAAARFLDALGAAEPS